MKPIGMAHCPGDKLYDNMNFNDSYMDALRRPFLNMSREELEQLRKKISETFQQPLSQDTFCDGWLKDVAVTYQGIHGYFSLAVCLFGTIANILNIVVLTRRDMAVAPINKILTGLAVADMLVMLEYVPFALYMIYEAEKRNFTHKGAVFLLCHVHFSQVMHTISIFLTLTLAVWRYIAISHPQRSLLLCTDARCHLAILSSYILPLFLCIPSYFITNIKQIKVIENHTIETLYHLDLGDSSMFSYNFNFWVYSVLIKLLPCAILTAISFCLINALYQVNKRKQMLKGYNACGECSAPERRVTKAEKRAERTTRMLVAVLLLFLITEFPQGILGLLSGIYGRCFYSKCYQYSGSIMDILALLNGAINFILYCAMSRQFRLTFGKLFKPKVLSHWGPKSSQTDVQSTFV